MPQCGGSRKERHTSDERYLGGGAVSEGCAMQVIDVYILYIHRTGEEERRLPGDRKSLRVHPIQSALGWNRTCSFSSFFGEVVNF